MKVAFTERCHAPYLGGDSLRYRRISRSKPMEIEGMSIHATARFEIKTWAEKLLNEVEGLTKLTSSDSKKVERTGVSTDVLRKQSDG